MTTAGTPDGFNPRAREGRDSVAPTTPVYLRLFQSTRPRGARLPATNGWMVVTCFNPRAREGRDR